MSAGDVSALYIPDVGPDDDALGAALAYGRARLDVGPLQAETKDPGSVLRKEWQRQTSCDPEVIASWFAGTDHGVFIHAGRSGLVIFDVDDPDLVPSKLAAAIAECSPPYQTTRDGDDRRGHYIFQQPPGRMLGNGTGKLGGDWGQIRGLHGVIVVAPSVHENVADGGRYVWRRTGLVPELPSSVAKLLDDATEASDAATDAQVEAFLDKHTDASRHELLEAWCRTYVRKVEAGESRHDRMVSVLTGAMKEARAGYFDARTAAATLAGLFLVAVRRGPLPGGKQGVARTPGQARSEWAGILASAGRGRRPRRGPAAGGREDATVTATAFRGVRRGRQAQRPG
uniref:DNA primase n=1 Tax=uncultured Nocardioidaceae bacterium TaxID=253824 RepID=A0A6J4KP78_9ACTN|nr:MAG: DNA primase [uncultured Nocardioidaceae bacterium]